MCVPKTPDIPAPPAQRQAMKDPEYKSAAIDDPMSRRRGYMAMMSRARPSLNAPRTTASLFFGG
jgi:hypothetical protein